MRRKNIQEKTIHYLGYTHGKLFKRKIRNDGRKARIAVLLGAGRGVESGRMIHRSFC